MTAPKWQSLKSWLWPIREHVCVYCGRRVKYKEATVDHFKPLSTGGSNDDGNCVLACKPCNNRKGETEFRDMDEAREWMKGGRK